MTRFVLGPPPANTLVDDGRWTRLPGYGAQPKAALAAVGVGVGLCWALVFLWKLASPASLPFGVPRVLDVLATVLAIVIGHELIHLAAFPGAGRRDAVFGIWPQRFAAFVQYRQPVARNRFVAAALAPLLLISVLPLVLAGFGWQAPPVLQWISVINGYGAGGDVLASFLLLRHVRPQGQVLESNDGLFQAAG
jgi:hypothetical protein